MNNQPKSIELPTISTSNPNSQKELEEEVAIKPVFIVNSIDEAIQSIAETFATIQGSKSSYGSSTYQDIVDPEGNVIQIEELIK